MGLYLTIALLSALMLPIAAAWLLTSTSPRERAFGRALDVAGKVAVLAVLAVAGAVWFVSTGE